MVAPTGTLPKSTAPGLELNAAAAEELEVSAAGATELPFALVMPEQPVKTDTDNDKKRATDRRTSEFHGRGDLREPFELCLL
jgi:hypothetical protein